MWFANLPGHALHYTVTMPVTAYISLGSNLGDRAASLRAAAERLSVHGEIVARSAMYETEPVQVTPQPDFLNAVLALSTTLPPQSLMVAMLSIERAMGRIRAGTKGPRVIDLDLLFYGDRCVKETGLTIPHPSLHLRRFVLAPLSEIAPDLRHPVLEQTVEEMLEALPAEDGRAHVFSEFLPQK